MYKFIALSLLLFAVCGIRAQTAIARFDTGGVRGDVTFTLLANGSIQIRTIFSNLPFPFALPYHVHEYPVDYRLDPTVRCGLTGGHHDPTNRLATFGSQYSQYCSMTNRSACEEGDLSGKFGRLTNGTFTYIDNNLSLNGRFGILYRSIVIHRVEGMTTPRYVCASIVPTTSLSQSITAVASFYGPRIAGDIYFFQQQGSSMSTEIYVNLNVVSTVRSLTVLSWNIKSSPPGFNSRTGDCGRVGANYNPRGRDVNNCVQTDAATCPEYALTQKHGYLNISAAGDKYFFTEVGGISLYGPNSIIGRSVSITNSMGVLACAAIGVVRPIVLQGALANGFIITATQYFPFSATRVATAGDRSTITVLTLQETGYIENANCAVSSIYNPFTMIQAPAGALPTRDLMLWNLLTQIPSTNTETVMTSTIPLSGPYSAAERRIYYAKGATTGCVNFRYYLGGRTDNPFVLRAYAIFSQVPNCRVHFTQLVSGTSYLPTDGSTPSNPNFLSGDVLITDNCTNSTGRDYRFIAYNGQCSDPFYNPYSISSEATNAQYSTECSAVNQRRCTVGNNLADGANDNMSSVVDTNLELAGAYGIISSRIRVRLAGQYCATAQASGQTSASFSVANCEQFGARLSNAILNCADVGANNFLNVDCPTSGSGPVSVTVNTVFGSNMQAAQDCIEISLNAGNRLAVPLISLLTASILAILFI